MRIWIRSFWLQKGGNEPGEYEDAFFPPWPSRFVEATYLRVAVGDGATETSFSGQWARELVDGFGKGRLPSDSIVEQLPRLQRRWSSRLSTASLPWYAQEKLKLGAFSSLLGLTIREVAETRQRRWLGVAVGDSCMFHLRRDRLLSAFPVSKSCNFNNHPVLVSSLPVHNRSVETALRRHHGTWEGGDRFILMTDAMAHWFLKCHEQGGRPWRWMDERCLSETRFSEAVEELRGKWLLRNDDVTVVLLDLDDTEA